MVPAPQFDTVRIVILTGAGISVEAGIPTFEEAYCSVINNPRIISQDQFAELLNQKSADLIRDIKNGCFEPTALHRYIAELVKRRETTQLGNTMSDVEVFTTNIDTLHEDAGCPSVRRIHGTLDKPILWYDTPHEIDYLEECLTEAKLLIVIGTRLNYPYISLLLSEYCMSGRPSILFDTNVNHHYSKMFTHHITDQAELIPTIEKYLRRDNE